MHVHIQNRIFLKFFSSIELFFEKSTGGIKIGRSGTNDSVCMNNMKNFIELGFFIKSYRKFMRIIFRTCNIQIFKIKWLYEMKSILWFIVVHAKQLSVVQRSCIYTGLNIRQAATRSPTDLAEFTTFISKTLQQRPDKKTKADTPYLFQGSVGSQVAEMNWIIQTRHEYANFSWYFVHLSSGRDLSSEQVF